MGHPAVIRTLKKDRMSYSCHEALGQEIDALHQMALYFTLQHQTDEAGRDARETFQRRVSPIRLFVPTDPAPDAMSLPITSDQLPKPLGKLIDDLFGCYQELLDGRYKDDGHM